LVAALSIVGIAFGLAHGMQTSAPDVLGTQAVTVHSGESLWALAQQVNPGVDPRVTIAAIRDANGLGSASIVQPGTTLAVPVFGSQR
jgi:LysM repeat protein